LGLGAMLGFGGVCVVQLSKGKAPMQIVEFERKKSADADGSVVASKAAAADNKVTNMSS
jgi:hypothetical protein